MRIALFITCLADAMFPEVGKATLRVLGRLGHDVEFPAEQTCCGQMHVNTGYQKQALPLVERFAAVFEPYDAVVAPSGSCVGSIRHQHQMIAQLFAVAKTHAFERAVQTMKQVAHIVIATRLSGVRDGGRRADRGRLSGRHLVPRGHSEESRADHPAASDRRSCCR